MGCLKLKKSERKGVLVAFRLSPPEFKALKTDAKNQGLSLTSLIRSALKIGAVQMVEGITQAEVMTNGI